MKNKYSLIKSLMTSLFFHLCAVGLFLNDFSLSSFNDIKSNQEVEIDMVYSSPSKENSTKKWFDDKSETMSYGIEKRQIIEKDISLDDHKNESSESFIGLGIQLSLEDTFVTVENNRFRGIKIDKVFKGYSAEKYGIIVGDILLKVDGVKVTENNSGSLLVFDNPRVINVELFRNNKIINYNIAIGQVLVSSVKDK